VPETHCKGDPEAVGNAGYALHLASISFASEGARDMDADPERVSFELASERLFVLVV
jgi:hypothetical protein